MTKGGIANAKDFFLWDYSSTLFPLTTNRLLVEKYASEVSKFIQLDVLAGGSFQPQQRVYASKREWSLRRTVKLDPVAEFFFYDLIFRNRRLFRPQKLANRDVFGFSIANNTAVPTMKSYAAFKKAVARNRAKFTHCAYFDVSSYFNHIYHHDLVRWFEEIGATAEDVALFGRFLREITAGRSVDCLPQGLYPAKMVGSSFLSFVESSTRVRAASVVRLMDDIWLFDDNKKTLISDFLRIQSLLGERGLGINERKSALILDGRTYESIPTDIDQMKIQLLQKRREWLMTISDYGDDSEAHDEPDALEELAEDEQDYLLELLKGDTIAEEDAELVLTLMKDHSADVVDSVPVLIREFPSLAKRMHSFCADLDDKDVLVEMLLDHVLSEVVVPEYQLFWFAKMAEDFLLSTKGVGDLLQAIYEHDQATEIVCAKVLEIPSKSFGLPELREEQLRNGSSGWRAWSAAVGSRQLAKGQRNQTLKYFRKASPMNRLIGEFVENSF